MKTKNGTFGRVDWTSINFQGSDGKLWNIYTYIYIYVFSFYCMYIQHWPRLLNCKELKLKLQPWKLPLLISWDQEYFQYPVFVWRSWGDSRYMFFVWKCFCGAHESLRQCFNLRFFFFFQRPRSSAVNHILVAVHNTRSSFCLDISRWCNWPPEKIRKVQFQHSWFIFATITPASQKSMTFTFIFLGILLPKSLMFFLEKMGGVNHTPPPTFQKPCS